MSKFDFSEPLQLPGEHFGLKLEEENSLGSIPIILSYCSLDFKNQILHMGPEDFERFSPEQRAETVERLKEIQKYLVGQN